MRTLDRYLSSIFVKNFLMAILSLSVLFFFQALLGDIFDNRYTPTQVIIYHLLDTPHVMVQMTAPAVLVATVLTLSGLSRTNELVACFAIGMGLRRITTLIISLVVIISCTVLVIDDRFLPFIYRRRTTFRYREMEKKPDFFLDIKQDKIWYRSKNLIYNLQRFDSRTRSIIGMSVYTFDDDFNLVQVVDAARAEFGPAGWKLLDGTVTTFPVGQEFPDSSKFVEKEMAIVETPKDFQEIEKEVKGLRLKELWKYIQRVKGAGADTKGYEVNFHSRISLSFIPLVMCFLGIPFSTRGRREGGVAKDLGLCIGVTFFYWLFYSIGLSLGTNGQLPPWLAAWLPSTIFAALAVTLIARQQR